MDWQAMFFQDAEDIARTLVVGVLAYVSLVIFLRISGKRTLAKLNAFDLVVTVALGSTLSAILLQESIALAEGLTALAVLIGYLVTTLSIRWSGFAHLVRSEPTLLARDGQLCPKAMAEQRITEAESLSAIRASGGRSIDDVAFLVLESDGTFSVKLRSQS